MAHVDCAKNNADDSFKKCPAFKRDFYLYNLPHNYLDLAVDENGLWAVYHYDFENFLVVSKLELSDMTVVHTWNLTNVSANITSVGNTFIMCGILYGIENSSTVDTRINFAYDLYNEEELEVDVAWKNPYGHTTMLEYNPYDRRLYFFDKGRLLSAPVRIRNPD